MSFSICPMTVQMSHFTYLLFACDDAILHLLSNFHTNRSKWRRNIEEKIFSMHSTAMLHLQILDFFLSNNNPQNRNSYLRTKLDRSRMIRCWDMEIELFFKMAAVYHLEFSKIAAFFMWPLSSCNSAFHLQILRKSAKLTSRCIRKTIFNMASDRHLEFVKFRYLLNDHPQFGIWVQILYKSNP